MVKVFRLVMSVSTSVAVNSFTLRENGSVVRSQQSVSTEKMCKKYKSIDDMISQVNGREMPVSSAVAPSLGSCQNSLSLCVA
ncbi:hypothetical protein [Teredinibacter franksiae]|uniref:hypothetical protein n=1 Tax=Teredinibacter franksiae TaxID=2761453 RepID=UPI00162A101E|nr:hypothetical protein [Teredinibacter franksiae]